MMKRFHIVISIALGIIIIILRVL